MKSAEQFRGAPAVFLGGVPTAPDVRRLMEAFKDRGQGASVTCAEIAELLQIGPRTSRFETVLGAWRKAMRTDRNLETVRERNTGEIRILRDNERASDAFSAFRRNVRGIRRSLGKAATIPVERLDERERNTSTHVRRVIEATYNSAREATKELATEMAPPKLLPRAR